MEIKCTENEQQLLIAILSKCEDLCPFGDTGKCHDYLGDCEACITNSIKWNIKQND